MKRAQRRGMLNDTDALLGALAEAAMDAHFVAEQLYRHIGSILDGTASAEERRTCRDRARDMRQATSRLQAAVLGRTDHAADGRQLRLA
jgi:hypothetical protein